LGKYKGEVISSSMIIFWQDTAFYHQGASSLKHPKIPVSYLLQWETIKEAKKRNLNLYNFWGIAPEGRKSHPWAGLTLFKKGFGGYVKKYVETQDLPLSQRYWLTFVFESLRRIKRDL
jgi:lipid II:glycine glycyltransferase (peptidoglycan interpeptide bridge formation enzyme)